MTKELLNINQENRRELAREYGKAVDVVDYYPGGVCCDIYLDKDSMTFSAIVGGNTFQDQDGGKVKTWAREQLQHVTSLTWVPAISVLDVGKRHEEYNYNGRRLEQHAISIDVHRFYVAQLPNGGVRAANWDVPEAKRVTTQDTPAVWVTGNKMKVEDGKLCALHESNIHVVPYTDELWAGLQELCKSIDALSNKLHQLIKTEDGLLKLQAVGAGVLRLLNEKNT